MASFFWKTIALFLQDFLGESFAEYETQKAVIKNIEEKIDTERAEIEKMGFFSKILNQVKLSTTSANLTGQERKLQKLYVDVGHLGVQASVFTREEAKDFDQEILDAHTKALQRQESLNEKKVLLANAQNAEQLIAQNIDAIGPEAPSIKNNCFGKAGSRYTNRYRKSICDHR